MALVARYAAIALAVTAASFATHARADEAQPCSTVDVDYALSATLELTDTPMGQGNGTHPIGPGTATVRFAGNDAKLMAYRVRESFQVDASAVFWKTHVSTDSITTITPDPPADGALSKGTLYWNTDVKARTDGTVTCDGSLCGRFGAPAPGTAPLHIAPHDVHFRPWTFSADMRSFTMPRSWVSHSESPQQSAFVTLTGREVRRTCAAH
jgi:hypothetical protein